MLNDKKIKITLCRALMLLLFLSSALGCKFEPDKNLDEKLTSAVVKYNLDGDLYEVPLGYHWLAYKKFGKWPTPVDKYVSVDSFNIFVLLPDFSPYSLETKEEFEKKVGWGNVLEIFVQRSNYAMRGISEQLESSQSIIVDHEMPSVSGLKHYKDTQGYSDKKKWIDLYVLESAEDKKYWIFCRMSVPYPSCQAYEINSDKYYLQYIFDARYLASWKDIRNRVDLLLNKFLVKDGKAL